MGPEAALMSEAVGTHFNCGRRDVAVFQGARVCILNPAARNPADARLVLFGNSHAQMYGPVWREILAQRGEAGLLVSMTGCLPTVAANYDVGCLREASARLHTVTGLPNVRTVVLAMTWLQSTDLLVDWSGHRLDNRDNATLIAALDDLISRLRERDRRVVLIGPVAIPGSESMSGRWTAVNAHLGGQ